MGGSNNFPLSVATWLFLSNQILEIIVMLPHLAVKALGGWVKNLKGIFPISVASWVWNASLNVRLFSTDFLLFLHLPAMIFSMF